MNADVIALCFAILIGFCIGPTFDFITSKTKNKRYGPPRPRPKPKPLIKSESTEVDLVRGIKPSQFVTYPTPENTLMGYIVAMDKEFEVDLKDLISVNLMTDGGYPYCDNIELENVDFNKLIHEVVMNSNVEMKVEIKAGPGVLVIKEIKDE